MHGGGPRVSGRGSARKRWVAFQRISMSQALQARPNAGTGHTGHIHRNPGRGFSCLLADAEVVVIDDAGGMSKYKARVPGLDGDKPSRGTPHTFWRHFLFSSRIFNYLVELDEGFLGRDPPYDGLAASGIIVGLQGPAE